MPGTESLRNSLRMPSLASSCAKSPKSEFGATSNDSLMQCARSALLSWIDELADLGGEEGAVLLALGHDQSHEFVVVSDRLLQVGRLEGGVADASGLDHRSLRLVARRHFRPHGRQISDRAFNNIPLRARATAARCGRAREMADRTATPSTSRLIRRKLSPSIAYGTQGENHMAGYKLATYQSPDGPRAGLVIEDKVFDAAKLTGKRAYATVLAILEDWRTRARRPEESGRGSRQKPRQSQPLGRTKLLAPVRWPSAIYCAGANYADHAAEMARRMNRPPEPDPHTQGLKAWHFIKASRTLADPGATVKISGVSEEGRLGGRARGRDRPHRQERLGGQGARLRRRIHRRQRSLRARPRAGARTSARPRRSRPTGPSTRRFDGSCPLGPWIVPASDIGDPQNLGLKLWVNDVLKQDSNTQRHDLQSRRADRAAVERHDAASRRPDPHRHAGRRRRRRAASSSRPATW